MSWTAADVETAAREIYQRAQLDPASLPGMSKLADALQIGIFEAPRRGIWGQGVKVIVKGRKSIWLAPRLPEVHRAHAIAHEIVEHEFPRQEHDPEGFCDAVGAAVLAPRGAFASAARYVDEDLAKLAHAFRTTESCAALRLGEVLGVPCVLVSRVRVRARGDAFEWPHEAELRQLARSRREVPGLSRVVLSDDKTRVFLRAA